MNSKNLRMLFYNFFLNITSLENLYLFNIIKKNYLEYFVRKSKKDIT
jgi:hypothetical protein